MRRFVSVVLLVLPVLIVGVVAFVWSSNDRNEPVRREIGEIIPVAAPPAGSVAPATAGVVSTTTAAASTLLAPTTVAPIAGEAACDAQVGEGMYFPNLDRCVGIIHQDADSDGLTPVPGFASYYTPSATWQVNVKYFAGHVNDVFDGLTLLRVGDPVVVWFGNVRYVYQVSHLPTGESKETFDTTASKALEAVTEPEAWFVTCGGELRGDGTHADNELVRARLISADQVA